ncbi:MAG: hypothetical protein V1660_02400 [archaeon]
MVVRGVERKVLDFKKSIEPVLDVLACKYEIDCLYLNDCLLPSIGACSVYMALDARDPKKKECINKFYKDKDILGYNPNFARAIFEVDGKRIGNVRVNSILLTPRKINDISRRKNLGIKVDESKLVYEAIAINDATDESALG